jgi:hypothetical protein
MSPMILSGTKAGLYTFNTKCQSNTNGLGYLGYMTNQNVPCISNNGLNVIVCASTTTSDTNGMPYYSTDGGVTFNISSVPSSISRIYKIRCNSDCSIVFIACSGRQPIVSFDYGATFVLSNSTAGVSGVFDVGFSEDGTYVTTFSTNYGVMRTSGGYNGTFTNTRTNNASYAIYGGAVSSTGQYQVANNGVSNNNAGVSALLSTDYGLTWASINGSLTNFGRSGDISSNGQYISVLNTNSTIGNFLFSSDYGSTFTSQTSAKFASQVFDHEHTKNNYSMSLSGKMHVLTTGNTAVNSCFISTDYSSTYLRIPEFLSIACMKCHCSANGKYAIFTQNTTTGNVFILEFLTDN